MQPRNFARWPHSKKGGSTLLSWKPLVISQRSSILICKGFLSDNISMLWLPSKISWFITLQKTWPQIDPCNSLKKKDLWKPITNCSLLMWISRKLTDASVFWMRKWNWKRSKIIGEMEMVKVNFHHWNAHCQQLMKLAHDFADEKLMEDNFHPSIDHLFTAHDFEIWQGNGSILLDAISSNYEGIQPLHDYGKLKISSQKKFLFNKICGFLWALREKVSRLWKMK